jgi:fluoride exporter
VSVQDIAAVAAGGLLGAVARHLVYIAAGQILGSAFPYATLIVNVAGSLAMGVLVETIALVWSTSDTMRLFLATGALGAFTTFSTFSLDFAVLFERRDYVLCALYTGLSFTLSIGALFVGLYATRRLIAMNG